jgi:C-terminal processing protease CtpA/Prc
MHKARLSIASTLCLIGALWSYTGGAAENEKSTDASRAERQQKLDAAQRRLDAAARDIAELSMSMSNDMMPGVRTFSSNAGQRAMLGVGIGSRDEREEGVEVVSVSPGGASAAAGLKAGDILLEINGKSLKRAGDDLPRERLFAAMRDVKPGDKVQLSYRRDGKTATATVVAEPVADRMFTMPFRSGERIVEGLPNFAFMRAEGVFGSAELAPLTPKLGQYFGAEQGLLVVRAPSDSRLKLEDGDVIVDIDGRVPSNAAHAFRILGSYQPGEKLKLNVLRMKKRMSFEITVPEETWEQPLRRSGVLSFPSGQSGVIMRGPAVPASPAMPAVPVPPPGDVLFTRPLSDDPV